MTISEDAGVNDATHGHEGSAMTGNPCPEPIPAPAAQTSRSEAGGWSGVGHPRKGDYVRPKPAGSAHIVLAVHPMLPGSAAIVDMMCGKHWTTYVIVPALEDPKRPCSRCWDLM